MMGDYSMEITPIFLEMDTVYLNFLKKKQAEQCEHLLVFEIKQIIGKHTQHFSVNYFCINFFIVEFIFTYIYIYKS